jgi:hypothetical protein
MVFFIIAAHEHTLYHFFFTGTSPDTDSDVKMFEEPDKWE